MGSREFLSSSNESGVLRPAQVDLVDDDLSEGSPSGFFSDHVFLLEFENRLVECGDSNGIETVLVVLRSKGRSCGDRVSHLTIE